VFFQLLAADYDAGGREVIEKLRERHPLQYLRLIASILPKRREKPRALPTERLTNEELDQLLGETKRLLAISMKTEKPSNEVVTSSDPPRRPEETPTPVFV
jgi:hypothetical protein